MVTMGNTGKWQFNQIFEKAGVHACRVYEFLFYFVALSHLYIFFKVNFKKEEESPSKNVKSSLNGGDSDGRVFFSLSLNFLEWWESKAMCKFDFLFRCRQDSTYLKKNLKKLNSLIKWAYDRIDRWFLGEKRTNTGGRTRFSNAYLRAILFRCLVWVIHACNDKNADRF